MTQTSTTATETFGLVGRDARLEQIVETIRRTAASNAPVLIEGESGTGKQLIATAFHAQSHRRSGPLIRVNCAAIPPELLQAELFASLETAAGGTLLLDEFADIPSYLQSKLLLVWQDLRLCRLIATTSRNTKELLAEDVLRKDLYFRLSTIKIKVPALRERLDDLPLLARHFLDRLNTKYNRTIRGISRETVFRLLRYDWPGNIRELESVLEHAVLFSSDARLRPESLPDQLQAKKPRHVRFVIPPLVPMEEIEREAILQTLARTSGNVKLSAQILHYPRPTFYRKLKKFGIKVDRDGPRRVGKLAVTA